MQCQMPAVHSGCVPRRGSVLASSSVGMTSATVSVTPGSAQASAPDPQADRNRRVRGAASDRSRPLGGAPASARTPHRCSTRYPRTRPAPRSQDPEASSRRLRPARSRRRDGTAHRRRCATAPGSNRGHRHDEDHRKGRGSPLEPCAQIAVVLIDDPATAQPVGKRSMVAPVLRICSDNPESVTTATVRSVSVRWSAVAPAAPNAGISRVLAWPGTG